MSRNSKADVPGGPTDCHVRPASVVRTTVPSVPLAHAVVALTAESPRNWAAEPVGVRCQEYVLFPPPAADATVTPARTTRKRSEARSDT
jgi:hypothetical protein